MTFERGVYLGRDSHGDITGGEEISITRKPLVSENRRPQSPADGLNGGVAECRRPDTTERQPCIGALTLRIPDYAADPNQQNRYQTLEVRDLIATAGKGPPLL